jgi:hypothetical protein
MEELTDKLNSVKLGDHPTYNVKIREKCYFLFLNNFTKIIPEKFGDEYIFPSPQKMAQNIEKSCYNLAFKSVKKPSWNNKLFKKNYYIGAMKVSANITYTPNSLHVLDCVKNKIWKPRELVYLTHDELAPEKAKTRESIYNDFILSRCNGKGMGDEKEVGDGMFTCRRCKSNKTEHTQKQTRLTLASVIQAMVWLKTPCSGNLLRALIIIL